MEGTACSVRGVSTLPQAKAASPHVYKLRQVRRQDRGRARVDTENRRMTRGNRIGGQGGRPPVALDGMGGDHAPQATVEGALKAATEGAVVIITGPEDEITRHLESCASSLGIDRDVLARLTLGVTGVAGPTRAPQSSEIGQPSGGISDPGALGSITIEHAPEVVEMGEEPARALRSKPRSSIAVACSLVAEGRAAAVVSAGSTGAAVAGAVLRFGRIEGISRPAIATVIPFPAHPIVLIDSGANAECKPEHLVQFAFMGAVFAETALGYSPARVGLLNIGGEESKGASLHKRAFDLLRSAASASQCPFEFVGNVEGYDLPHAAADVVVTDGFTGNVVLKLSEGLARSLIQEIVGAISAKTSGETQVQAVGALLDLRKRVNADGMGGACLLGVNSLAVIAHGSSNSDSIAKAVLFASTEKAGGIQQRIAQAVSRAATEDAF